MIADERGQQLHDRATRGVPLTAAERVELEQWYAEGDAAEDAMLRAHGERQDPLVLREQINALLIRLETENRRLRELDEQNDALRAEIAGLKRQLAEAVARSNR